MKGSMKGMVEGECGQSNALVGLASGFGQSNQRVAPSATKALTGLLPSSSRGDAFANEYLHEMAQRTVAPRTFDMKAMMGSLPPRTMGVPTSSASALANNWSAEFAQSRPAQHPLAAQWSQQYLASSSRPVYENAWNQSTSASSSAQAQGPSSSLQSSNASLDMMWSSEYLDNFDTNTATKANEMADAWSKEFLNEDYWKKTMEGAWDDAHWQPAGDLTSTQEAPIYKPEEENPFVGESRLVERGDEFLNQGDLGNSILCYEAAVQQNPGDAQAWCRLGLSHAENEVDVKAIAAFRKCLEIEPANQEALLALSVSLANESMENEALAQLEKWITVHQGGDGASLIQKAPFGSFLDHAWFERVEEKFLTAARRQEGAADANLQNALGVLYNLNRNFDRAVDSIRLAIAARPQDARLWNRLGATLANGDRTAEAVAAYREALRLFPHYVRARYNLGITCMHLSSYKEAIEHFVSALELQKGNTATSSIWNTMRSATLRSMSGNTEAMLRAIDAKDLNGFKDILRAPFSS